MKKSDIQERCRGTIEEQVTTNWLAPNPFMENARDLTKIEATGLRHMFLSAGLVHAEEWVMTPAWDVLHRQTIQDKFGRDGSDVVLKLEANGVLRKDGVVWRITTRGKESFLRYIQEHGMPKRSY